MGVLVDVSASTVTKGPKPFVALCGSGRAGRKRPQSG